MPIRQCQGGEFFKTLKRDEVYLNHYQTFADASENLERFIDDVYNAKRLHSSLRYLPPIEFEHDYLTTLGS